MKAKLRKNRSQSFRKQLKSIDNLLAILESNPSTEVAEMLQMIVVEKLQAMENKLLSFSPPTNDYNYERK